MTTNRRAAIYLRVSDKRQLDNHSLEAQERLARELAERESWLIPDYAVYRDEAQRGGSADRPELLRLLKDIQDGKIDVVIVYAIDRLSREDDAEKYFKIFARHNVRIVSLSQYVDETTAAGRLTRRMFNVMATYYSEELAEKYKRGKKQRVVKGKPNGDVPFGYILNPLTKQLEADPHDSPGVVLMFTEYATGHYSDLEIALLLNEHGHRTANKTRRRPFSKDSVRDILKKKFYLGWVSYKGELFAGQHPALIDQATFDKCQAVRASRRSHSDSSNRSTRIYPLSGLLYCRECAIRYRGHNHPLMGQHYYQPARQYAVACTQRATARSVDIEGDLVEILSGIRIPDDWRAQISDFVGKPIQPAEDVEVQRERINERLRRAKNLYLMGELTDAELAAEKANVAQKLAELQPAPADEFDYAQAVESLKNFGKLYDLATPEQRKRLFQTMFERVYLLGDEIASIMPRTVFYPLLKLWACGPDEIRVPTRRLYRHVSAIALTQVPYHLTSPQRPI